MFWESNGIVRFLGYFVTFLGNFVVPNIPAVAPFAPGVVFVGTAIAGAGHANAILK